MTESGCSWSASAIGVVSTVSRTSRAVHVLHGAPGPIGSRPARRRVDGCIESLRAIPWIFAWTQNRLILPAWLGVGTALRQALDEGRGDSLMAMRAQ